MPRPITPKPRPVRKRMDTNGDLALPTADKSHRGGNRYTFGNEEVRAGSVAMDAAEVANA